MGGIYRDFAPYKRWLYAILGAIFTLVVVCPATYVAAQAVDWWEVNNRRVSGVQSAGAALDVLNRPVVIGGLDAAGNIIIPTYSASGSSNINLAEVGGAAFAQGSRAIASSLSVTQDTTANWTVMGYSGSAAGAATRLTLGDFDTGVGVIDRLQVGLISAGGGALVPATWGAGQVDDAVGTLREVPASTKATVVTYDPDQAEAAADIAADATRKSIVCCVNGTTQVLVREGAATGGTTGMRYNAGYTSNDGNGACFKITAAASDVWLYDVSGLGLADVTCTIEVY